jgi:hypothetical protein
MILILFLLASILRRESCNGLFFCYRHFSFRNFNVKRQKNWKSAGNTIEFSSKNTQKSVNGALNFYLFLVILVSINPY